MFSTEKRPVAQAIVLYLQRPYSELEGERERLIAGIFGPGNAAGTGEALEEYGTIYPSIGQRTNSLWSPPLSDMRGPRTEHLLSRVRGRSGLAARICNNGARSRGGKSTG
jgi:hypothetical protein